jgi:hypothetical protein
VEVEEEEEEEEENTPPSMRRMARDVERERLNLKLKIK